MVDKTGEGELNKEEEEEEQDEEEDGAWVADHWEELLEEEAEENNDDEVEKENLFKNGISKSSGGGEGVYPREGRERRFAD